MAKSIARPGSRRNVRIASRKNTRRIPMNTPLESRRKIL